MDKNKIGVIIGAGLATVAGVASLAAVARPIEGLPEWASGIIQGYNTYPGDVYDIYVQDGNGKNIPVARGRGIWFSHVWDYYKYLYDHVRPFGLPVAGTIVAIGHSMKAGVHATGRKYPMRGYNNWGVKAGKLWKEDGKPYWMASTKEYDAETGKYYDVFGAQWRFYEDINDSISNWLKIMKDYPIAYNELFSKNPDPYRYHYGLINGVDGKSYATGASDMGDVIENAMSLVPSLLHEHFGYNL